MNSSLDQNKIEAICKIIDGRVIEDEKPSALLIRGLVYGFPATLEVVAPIWPFGVIYYIETNLIDDPDKQVESSLITIRPRMVSGILGFIGRLLLINPGGQKIGEKKIDNKYILSFDHKNNAERLLFYPGLINIVDKIQLECHFSELVVNLANGVFLQQPTTFNKLNIDVVRESYKNLGAIAQIIVEAF